MQASIMQPYEVRLVRRAGTKRQRRARTLKVAAAMLLAVLFLVLAPRAVAMMNHTDAPVVTYTVDYGDNLWDIADRYNSGGDVRRLISAIKQANHLESATVHPGQVLVIPKLGK